MISKFLLAWQIQRSEAQLHNWAQKNYTIVHKILSSLHVLHVLKNLVEMCMCRKVLNDYFFVRGGTLFDSSTFLSWGINSWCMCNWVLHSFVIIMLTQIFRGWVRIKFWKTSIHITLPMHWGVSSPLTPFLPNASKHGNLLLECFNAWFGYSWAKTIFTIGQSEMGAWKQEH